MVSYLRAYMCVNKQRTVSFVFMKFKCECLNGQIYRPDLECA